MVGSSILPVSLYKGKLYFLFGKENELEKSAHGFSDFGGGIESGESAFETACREGAEELTGFLGGNIKQFIRKNGGYIRFGDPAKYVIHVVCIDYDEKLPEYYNNNHRFLWERMDKHMLSRTKLFEKIEIKWFSVNDIKQKMGGFRHFYQDILKEHILTKIPKIIKFCRGGGGTRRLGRRRSRRITRRHSREKRH